MWRLVAKKACYPKFEKLVGKLVFGDTFNPCISFFVSKQMMSFHFPF